MAEKRSLQPFDDLGRGIRGVETIGVIATLLRMQRWDRLDDRVTLAAYGPDGRRLRERLEKKRTAGARRADDEDRTIEMRPRVRSRGRTRGALLSVAALSAGRRTTFRTASTASM